MFCSGSNWDDRLGDLSYEMNGNGGKRYYDV